MAIKFTPASADELAARGVLPEKTGEAKAPVANAPAPSKSSSKAKEGKK